MVLKPCTQPSPHLQRDFSKIYDTTPKKWLQKRKLEQAYFLIQQKNRKPSDVYLDVGFESLSHFSYAFKKEFGMTPTELRIKDLR